MKKAISLLLALVMLFSLSACGAAETTAETMAEPTAETTAQTTAETILAAPDNVFVDDFGREVEFSGEISSIVPTGPLSQIVLYAIAPDMLVGLASKWYDSAEGIIPEEYRNLPYFGQLYNSANLNVEALALAGPQVIIDIGQKMSTGVEDMQTLQTQTNIPTVFISASLESMPQTFRKLGQLLHRQEKAEELAQFCERVYDRTISILEQVGDQKVNALYVLGEEGLNVLARDSYHSELIDILTNNVAVVDSPSSKGSGNEVTMEQIALWNPDLILFAPGSIYETVAEMDTWRELDAIANGNYLEVPEGPHNWLGTPPAVQRCLGMIWLTAELYPDYCDYNVKEEILEYYELFYGCRLTDAQYESLTKNAFLE